MNSFRFEEGAFINIEGKGYKLIKRTPQSTWQVEHNATKHILEFPENELFSLYTNNKLIFCSQEQSLSIGNTHKIKSIGDYNSEQWDAAKVRRLYVVNTLEYPNTRPIMEPIIKATWEKLKEPDKIPHFSTVVRWKNKYIKSGRDITSLIDRNSAKGNSKPRYPDEVVAFVQVAIENVYLKLERGNLQETLERSQALTIRDNKLRPNSLQLPLPSRRLVKGIIDKIPAYDRYAARHGRTAAVKQFRTVLSHRTTSAPLERAEIDHSKLDLMVIDDQTHLPLGRPWLTVCIDDFTRSVLGIFISFEPPSHFSVGRCLKQVFLPKVDIKKQYPVITNDWNAHGIITELVVDNGAEFHSVSLENACYSLGIEIHYSARKTPWFKGKVERFLATLNRAVAHGTPGTTFANIFDKDEYDPSKHAIVHYSVLKEIIYKWIVDVYHQKPHSALGVSPAAMWSSSIASNEILVPDNPAWLDAILGQSESRVLTHKGVELFGLLYNSTELRDLRRRIDTKTAVDIRIDTSNLENIIVFSPDKREMFTVPALYRDYTKNLSLWQHKLFKKYSETHFNDSSAESWLEAKLEIAEIVDNELMYKKQKSRTKIARFQDKSHQSSDDFIEQDKEVESNEQFQEQANQHTIDPIPPDNKLSDDQLISATKKSFTPVIRKRMGKFNDSD